MPVFNPVGVQGAPGLNPRGVWSAAATYNKSDFVSRSGGSYMALANGLTGSGTDPATDVTDWLQVAAAGTVNNGVTSATSAAGNDSRLSAPDLPALNGLKAWTYDPAFSNSAATITSGQVVLHRVYYPSPDTFNTIYLLSTVGSSGLTLARVGLYDSAGNKLAQSNDLHVAFATSGLLTCPLSASFNWPGGAGAFFYVAWVVVGTTSPTYLRIFTSGDTLPNAGITAAPFRTMAYTGQTDLPATLTPASGVLYGAINWVGVA